MTFFSLENRRKLVLLLILSATVFLSVLDIFIVNIALPSIQKGLNSSESDLQLVIAAYLVAYAAFIIFGSKIGDRVGRKQVLLLSTIGFIVSSLLCGVVQTPAQLNIARALQGMSAAFMVPQGLAYIQIIFSTEGEKAQALGIYGSIAGVASVIGQLLGGLLPAVDMHIGAFGHIDGWRLIFLINVPLGLLVVFLINKHLPTVPSVKAGRFDYKGLILLLLFLVSLTYPLIRGRELHWPLWSIALLVLSFPLLLWLIYDQNKLLRQKLDPLVNFEVFRDKYFRLGTLLSLFYFIAQDSYFMITGIFLQDGVHIPSVHVGILFVFQGLGYVLGSVLTAKFMAVYGSKVVKLGLVTMMVALVGHLFAFDNSVPDLAQYLLLAIYGIGCGSVLPSLLAISLKSVPLKHAGTASGIYSTIQQTAVALGIAFTGGLFFFILDGGESGQDFSKAYRIATYLNILSLGVVLLILQSPILSSSRKFRHLV